MRNCRTGCAITQTARRITKGRSAPSVLDSPLRWMFAASVPLSTHAIRAICGATFERVVRRRTAGSAAESIRCVMGVTTARSTSDKGTITVGCAAITLRKATCSMRGLRWHTSPTRSIAAIAVAPNMPARASGQSQPNQTLQQTVGACRLSQGSSSLGPCRC